MMVEIAYNPQLLLPPPEAQAAEGSANRVLKSFEDLDRAARYAPTSQPVILPISLLDEKRVLPRDYVILKYSQRCSNCGTIHEWSETYGRNELPPRHNMGKHIQNLIPIKEFRFNLPLRVVVIPVRHVPACHECASTCDLSRYPDPRDTPLWNAVLVRKQDDANREQTKKPGRPRTKPTTPTLDDIL